MDPMYAYCDVDERTMLRVQKMIREGKFTTPKSGPLNNSLVAASTIGQLYSPLGPAPLLTAALLYPGKSYVIVPILLGLSNEEGYPHQGNIDFVNNQVDQSTGTIRIRGVFPNHDEVLTPGLFARIRIPLGNARKAIMVSDRALGSNQGQPFLYVVNDKNEVEYRPVETGPLRDGLRVVEEGVGANERVIVNGLLRVRPGLVVNPKPGEMVPEVAAPEKKNGAVKPKPGDSAGH
jgi:multidrug efflux pump subunit AcrA (membrane-fusion protein)